MISLAARSTEERFAIVGGIVSLLNASVFFRQRSRWPTAVVILRGKGERSYVTSRVDHAAWLRANDLTAAAKECLTTKTRAGEVLLWIELDSAEMSEAGFEVIPLASEARSLLAVMS